MQQKKLNKEQQKKLHSLAVLEPLSSSCDMIKSLKLQSAALG